MRILIYLLTFMVFSASVSAEEYFIIDGVKIDSFAGLVDFQDNSIYAGSSISYNIIFYYNGTGPILENQNFQVRLINPSGDTIENESFSLNITPNTKYSINSSVGNGMYKLIYADVPGVYKLTLISKSLRFYESKETGFRQDTTIPIFFEVRRLEEKRLLDATQELIKSVEAMANESSEISREILKLTNNIYVATLVMLTATLVMLTVALFKCLFPYRN